MSDEAKRRQNRLASESSPYLRQHAENPVDWFPWGPEALSLAKAQDRPIFLSVGYSACHWCHVMAHESFEDPATAAFINGHFLPIKLDREERPDLDALYMRSVVLLTGSGGWPLSVFLTPDLRPFFGGTYFPPEPRHGMPSFMQVLRGIAEAYRSRRGDVQTSSVQILDAVRQSFEGSGGPVPAPSVSERARRAIMERFDARRGGFGGGPKFPQPALLEFLLDEADRGGDAGLRDQVLFTLDRMEAGGVRDQVGGAFHRYSVDRDWRVPHYEKMLYDNAQLASLYSRAFALTGRGRYRRVASEILSDLGRTMAAPGGGFVAALDADSEGEEGKFYLWTPEQVLSVLGAQEGSFINGLYGITGGPGLEGRTPHRREAWEGAARAAGVGEDALAARVREDLDVLAAERARRVWPGVDTKVLTDWNALAAEASLLGFMATGQTAHLEAGLETLEQIWSRCWRGDRLFHVWDGERAKVPGFLADHAYLARAEWTAYAATGAMAHLERAGRLLETSVELFGGGGSGPWVDALAEEGDLPLPVRDTDDGVLPAPISVTARLLWNWQRLTGSPSVGRILEQLLASEGGALAANPGARPLLAGLVADRALPPVEVVVAGPSMPAIEPLLRSARKAAPAGALVLPLVLTLRDAAESSFDLFEGRAGAEDPRAHVCVDRTCGMPISDPEELERALEAAREVVRLSYIRALGAG